MFTHSPSDRMQLLGMGELLHPGSCIHCGNGTCEKGYVKLDVHLEFEGELYLCYYCTVQAGEILGMMIPEEVNIITEQLSSMTTMAGELKKELADKDERLNAYDIVMRSLPPILSPDVASGMASAGLDPISDDDSQSASGADNQSASSTAESSESTKGSGSGRSSSVKLSDGGTSLLPSSAPIL